MKEKEAQDILNSMPVNGTSNFEAALISKQISLVEVHMLKSTDNGLRKDKFLKTRDKMPTIFQEGCPEIKLGTPEHQAQFQSAVYGSLSRNINELE